MRSNNGVRRLNPLLSTAYTADRLKRKFIYITIAPRRPTSNKLGFANCLLLEKSLMYTVGSLEGFNSIEVDKFPSLAHRHSRLTKLDDKPIRSCERRSIDRWIAHESTFQYLSSGTVCAWVGPVFGRCRRIDE